MNKPTAAARKILTAIADGEGWRGSNKAIIEITGAGWAKFLGLDEVPAKECRWTITEAGMEAIGRGKEARRDAMVARGLANAAYYRSIQRRWFDA